MGQKPRFLGGHFCGSLRELNDGWAGLNRAPAYRDWPGRERVSVCPDLKSVQGRPSQAQDSKRAALPLLRAKSRLSGQLAPAPPRTKIRKDNEQSRCATNKMLPLWCCSSSERRD